MSSYVKWYYFLNGNQKTNNKYKVNALKDAYNTEQLCHMVIISQDTDTGRRYTAFESYFELYDFMKNIDISEKFLHELCLGGVVQKPRFDIDMKHKDLPKDTDPEVFGNLVLETIMESSLEMLVEAGIKITETEDDANDDTLYIGDIFSLCTSHGKKKHSYHLVLNKVAHRHSAEARGFYEKVIEKSSSKVPDIKKWVDEGIYSNNHSLRLIGSLKIDEEEIRVKAPIYPVKYKGEEYTCRAIQDAGLDEDVFMRVILERSLISWIHDFIMLPSYAPMRVERPDCPDVDSEELKLALEYLDKDLEGEQPFEVAYVKGTTIALRRKTDSNGKKIPSFCKKCNVIHHAENPFLIVRDGYVSFHCRRVKTGRVLKQGSSRRTEDVLNFIRKKVKQKRGVEIKDVCLYENWGNKVTNDSKEEDTELDNVHAWAVQNISVEPGYHIVVNKNKENVYSIFAENNIGIAYKIHEFNSSLLSNSSLYSTTNIQQNSISSSLYSTTNIQQNSISSSLYSTTNIQQNSMPEDTTLVNQNRYTDTYFHKEQESESESEEIEESEEEREDYRQSEVTSYIVQSQNTDRIILENTDDDGNDVQVGLHYTQYQSFPFLLSYSNDNFILEDTKEEVKEKPSLSKIYKTIEISNTPTTPSTPKTPSITTPRCGGSGKGIRRR